MKKHLKKIRVLFALMVVVILTVSCVGLRFTVVKGKYAISKMSTNELKKFAPEIADVLSGEVVSGDQEVLYSYDNSGSETTFNLIGDKVGLANNTIVMQYAEELSNVKKYSFFTGMNSLKGKDKVTLKMTLDKALQDHMISYMKAHHVSGSLIAYNYETGKIICMASTPVTTSDTYKESKELEGSLINKNLGLYQPGSTMKLVTTSIFAEQLGDSIYDLKATCNGKYSLSENEEITCGTGDGTFDIVDAMGVSCNVFFAQSIVDHLDLNKAEEQLKSLGFDVNNSVDSPAKASKQKLGKLNASNGFVHIERKNFNGLWNLIGQQCMVSPLTMVQIAGAISQDGKAAKPYLVSKIAEGEKINFEHQVEYTQMYQTKTANLVHDIVTKSTSEYYYPNGGSKITWAKTGTAENGSGNSNKLYIGCAESQKIAFYAVVEHYDAATMASARELAEEMVTFTAGR